MRLPIAMVGCRLATLGTLAALLLSPAGELLGVEETEEQAKKAAKMIDLLANRNKAPKLILPSWKSTRPAELQELLPLFPKDYDWKEQRRIVKALKRLCKANSVELWEEMVRKAHDRRYSLTAVNPVESTENWTVGGLCGNLAHTALESVVDRHLPKTKGRRIALYLGITDLGKWRKERMNMPLYELQVELCERALGQLAKLKGLSQREKDVVRKKIKSEISRLKTTKQPVMRKKPPVGRWELYSAKRAMEIRKLLRSTKTSSPKSKPSK